MRQQLASQLAAAYPQADLRPLTRDVDPATIQADEQAVACTLGLRAAAYLPIRCFTDLDVDGERAAQADPVLGILSALGDLPPGWRGLRQLVSAPSSIARESSAATIRMSSAAPCLASRGRSWPGRPVSTTRALCSLTAATAPATIS